MDPSDKAHCTTIAQDQWTWFQSSGLINDDNLINDGLEYNCTNTGLRTVWSYNEGVILLSGLVELNRASPDQSIIDSANVLAKAAIANLTDSNHIVHDVCEPNCFPDQTQFKGIFIRNLVLLQQEPPCDLYKTVITANAESIWSHDRVTKNNTFSVDWSGPVVGKVNAIISSSALDGLIGAISVTQQ